MIPTLTQRIKSYLVEREFWISKGRPMRTEKEIQLIYETFCEPCEFREKKLCGTCGCYINLGTTINKIAFATTECSKGKWTSRIRDEDNKQEKVRFGQGSAQVRVKQTVNQKIKNKQSNPPQKGGCGCHGR